MGRLRILLVDDEPDFLEIMGTRIEGWGHEVAAAHDGKEAIEAVKHKKPDIIVLDYLMPGMNGVETLKKIRQIDKHIPVIMFTAHPDLETIKGSERLGISAFIPKISTYSDVLDALQSAIGMIAKKIKS